ncbi:HIRAN domain-containing protein [Bifidobacterium margollesii]|uniref:HIRAN domain-containing protein n=1 Tax=Bifidobacterium margollesii TaxID=2020964 RepID=A0A2N5J9M5_9BIFI|nr:HIRAN domain-containing protein [Bifidobacterium margollesii]PLS30912.1 HIRAN domain-containing protein [Bifidobacterium margollesii]
MIDPMRSSDSGGLVPLPGDEDGELALFGGIAGDVDMPKPYADAITLIERTYLVGSRGFGDSGASDQALRGLNEKTAESDGTARLRLEREPQDAQDRWAVKVYAGDVPIGYLRAHENEIIARLMDAGKHVYAEYLETETLGDYHRLWVRLVLDD